ncbi:hypothetical protein B7P43_G04281 [Cryptotermes secundus]|uniref:Uncharacterized protein n=1 Tax=Cryptotermes secundus TaxID=105785 RepID=A0A2J7QFX5_9NEOP|nr:hypothetical protein B7P43_G04281 [Cryptotermes secundus]
MWAAALRRMEQHGLAAAETALRRIFVTEREEVTERKKLNKGEMYKLHPPHQHNTSVFNTAVHNTHRVRYTRPQAHTTPC